MMEDIYYFLFQIVNEEQLKNSVFKRALLHSDASSCRQINKNVFVSSSELGSDSKLYDYIASLLLAIFVAPILISLETFFFFFLSKTSIIIFKIDQKRIFNDHVFLKPTWIFRRMHLFYIFFS